MLQRWKKDDSTQFCRRYSGFVLQNKEFYFLLFISIFSHMHYRVRDEVNLLVRRYSPKAWYVARCKIHHFSVSLVNYIRMFSL